MLVLENTLLEIAAMLLNEASPSRTLKMPFVTVSGTTVVGAAASVVPSFFQ
jgi:hypothetical protein